MNIQDIALIFNDNTKLFQLFFKGFALVGSGINVFYCLAVLRQTYSMIRAIDEAHTKTMKFVSWLQFVIALILAFLAWAFL